MQGLLSRVPVKKQKKIAGGLLYAAVMAALFGYLLLSGYMETSDTEKTGWLWWEKTTTIEIPLAQRLPYLYGAIGLFAFVLVCVILAVALYTLSGSLKRYTPILTGVESISIQKIADITNSKPARVYRDIQSMIDSGMINDFYIDYGGEQVVSKKYVPKTSYKTVVACPGCGARNELVVGITRTCDSCGQPLQLKRR